MMKSFQSHLSPEGRGKAKEKAVRKLPDLILGEAAVELAPVVELGNGNACIPQHYLQYDHNLRSVEALVADIEYSDNYPIFVCSDGVNKNGEENVFLQVGIIGFDNYCPQAEQVLQKIVYGRRWRVEPSLPTSEVIQTAFLAILKAREHEVRERFRIRTVKPGSVDTFCQTTPFNTHHDLPLAAANQDLLGAVSDELIRFDPAAPGDAIQQVKEMLARVSYDFATISLLDISEHRGKWLIDLGITASDRTSLAEVAAVQEISLMIPQKHGRGVFDMNALYYALMDEFLRLSNQHVEEHFTYRSFARFSRQNRTTAFSEMALTIRDDHQAFEQSADFKVNFQQSNYTVDQGRVPRVRSGVLGDKIKASLARFGDLAGILPDCE